MITTKSVKAIVVGTAFIALASAFEAQFYYTYGAASDPRVPTELKHWYDDRYPNG
jgi:hypothetical protein